MIDKSMAAFREKQRGYNDCKAGVPHTPQNKDYDAGYALRYEQEQVMAYLSAPVLAKVNK